MNKGIPKRIASTIISSLNAGVVPRIGTEHIAVGRDDEMKAIKNDLEIIEDGGSTFRFVCGSYGSGKSFLLQMVRNYATENGFVVMDADLSPDRRLQGSQNQGLATYKELLKNMSTKTKSDGGALTQIIEKWISNIQTEVMNEYDLEPGTEEFSKQVKKKIHVLTNEIETLVNGFDFARAIVLYYEAFEEDDFDKKSKVMRWFRGEYSTKSEAKKDLGINLIVTDQNWYDFLKLYAEFVVNLGYKGMIILIDELVNLYCISNKIVRHSNYEKLLMMYNDVLQGKASSIGIIMGCTPECMEDSRTGIFSYDALRSRLESGRYANGKRNLLSPIIDLEPLQKTQIMELLRKLDEVHGIRYNYECNISDQDKEMYLESIFNRPGAKERVTPREMIRGYVELLNLVHAEECQTMASFIGRHSDIFDDIFENTDVKEEFVDFEI